MRVLSYEGYARLVRNTQALIAITSAISEGLSTANAGYTTSTIRTSSYYSGNLNTSGSVSAYGSSGYAHGLYSGNTSYSGSSYTTSTTRTYDAAAAYQAQVLSQNRMNNLLESQWNIRNAIQRGYLKKNTIYPGETIQGYVLVGRIPYASFRVIINVNGASYRYDWEN